MFLILLSDGFGRVNLTLHCHGHISSLPLVLEIIQQLWKLLTYRGSLLSLCFSLRLSNDCITDWMWLSILKTKPKPLNPVSFPLSSVNSRNIDQHLKWSSKQNVSPFQVTLILDRLVKIVSDVFLFHVPFILLCSFNNRAAACPVSLLCHSEV